MYLQYSIQSLHSPHYFLPPKVLLLHNKPQSNRETHSHLTEKLISPPNFWLDRDHIALLALGVIVLDEILKQVDTFLSLDFVHFDEVLQETEEKQTFLWLSYSSIE